MSLEITLFRDFKEDNRYSMEVYADGLSEALQSFSSSQCTVREYRPRLWPPLGTGVWRMRLARYLLYPWQIRREQSSISHIIDQGYSHLLLALRPETTVVTIHDLIPIIKWKGNIKGFKSDRRPWLNSLSFSFLRRAAHIIAVSKNTKRDAIHYCGVSPERISVIPYGIHPAFRPFSTQERAAACLKWNLPADGTKRILITGSARYKNLPGAINAFDRLQRMNVGSVQLVKLGHPDSNWVDRIEEKNLSNSSICLGSVSPREMPEIYNIVDCLLFPSIYEGFGRPPLEAMACGTPVVASNAASLPEVVADAGMMCDPHDHYGLAMALKDLLTAKELRQAFISKGISRAREFTWEGTARQTMEVYERVARENWNEYRD